jgi:hypothetical protein
MTSAFLVGIVVTIFAANRAGSGAGWGTGIGSLIAVGAVMNAEEHFRRWRHQALKVMHLGKEFQELAARKSLSFNLAMEFIEQHYKKSS